MEGYAAATSRDGQGGALLREVTKLEKFEDDATEVLGRELLGCPATECSHATLVRGILSVSPGDGLQAWHAVTQWLKPRSVVEQATSMARLISPKRTKNVTELQVAVMQWELNNCWARVKVLRGGG